ncbi:hypothetical protein C3K47_00250 [Solitalea longa]|uniref:DoxX family protein n=1 Tax=Solitalea longa TaxID=2079460 RepID=A0A2S5A9J4_9SPHI|nr:hypothetical protein [Solitalea longa]POY38969.1 hypothetical protein C3K47_00250 [Solitalea longa]
MSEVTTLEGLHEETHVAHHIKNPPEWKAWQKVAFRISFVFFSLLCVPTNLAWYTRLFSIDFAHFQWRIFYEFANFSTNFYRVSSESGRWGIASYVNWLIVLIIAVVIGLTWGLFDKKRKQYNVLYYWLRVIVRYRIAVGIIAFGFIKLFPTQMPYPSLSVFNTNFGDLMPEKLYWASVGIVPAYEVFLGFVEVFGGALLFFRRTSALGAIIIGGISINIAYANHAYDGGVHVYSAFFALLSLFILADHLPAIWNLLIKERDTVPVQHYPTLTKVQRYISLGVKYAIVLSYTVVFFYFRLYNHLYLHYDKEPATAGLSGTTGYYNVTEFKINNVSIPYSPLDSLRWQDAIFEKWSTFTFKVNRPVKIDLSNGSSQKKDIDRNYELSGSAGGRRFFYYDADTVNHILYLQDKNTGTSEEGGAAAGGARNNARRGEGNSSNQNSARSGGRASGAGRGRRQSDAKGEKLVLHYTRPSDSRIILSGVNDKKDSIYVVLDRVEKRYPIVEGRRYAQTFTP